jgi:ribonuclease P protein component
VPRPFAHPRSRRIVSKIDFERAFRQGSRARGAILLVVARENELGETRLGLSVGKSIWKGAVQRNRVRRIFREAFRLSYPELPAGFDLVLNFWPDPDGELGRRFPLHARQRFLTAPALPAEIVANIGAAANGYQLVASVEIPLVGNLNASTNAYLVDDRAAPGTFSRVAYYLETQKTGQPVQYVWTSMDAFTINKGKLAIPTLATGAVFQQNVTNLSVLSNVAGVVTGRRSFFVDFGLSAWCAARGARFIMSKMRLGSSRIVFVRYAVRPAP